MALGVGRGHVVVDVVGSQSPWRSATPLPARLQDSHQNGGSVFSSSWRIREPCGCTTLASFILPRPTTRRKRLRCLCSRVSHHSPVKSIPPQSANASSMTATFCEGRSRSGVRRGWRTAAARCSANQQGYRGHSAPKAFERREQAHVRPQRVDLDFGTYPDQPTKDNYRCLRMME